MLTKKLIILKKDGNSLRILMEWAFMQPQSTA